METSELEPAGPSIGDRLDLVLASEVRGHLWACGGCALSRPTVSELGCTTRHSRWCRIACCEGRPTPMLKFGPESI